MDFRLIHIIIMMTLVGTIARAEDSIPAQHLQEVVVTAQEVRNATSTSRIDSTAMKHLQPSSFTDLLELLPGGVSVDPQMGKVNSIVLRQASGCTMTDDYATTALGTAFVVDGMPINTDAQMQTTPDSNQAGRISIGHGVDMRSLTTDDIEHVEIVRGIPSVEYGELTSGLVKIKRKSGVSRLEARFKADNQSRLIYAGKGFAIGRSGFIINTSVSWLDAKIDPRNSRENYKRLGATLRSDYYNKSTALTLQLHSALDFTATFETDNNDPDLTVNGTIDDFSKRNHSLSWSNNLTLKPVDIRFFREAALSAGITAAWEHLHQRKHVASSRIMPLPVSLLPGSNYVDYLPLLYLSDFDVYGAPVTSFAKLSTRFRHVSNSLTAGLNLGAEWNYSKNFGCGEVYDLSRPLLAGNNTRPRPFRDVPAMNKLSAYAEAEFKLYPGNFTIGVTPGVRVTSLVGLDDRYSINGRPYIDHRVNMTCVFPSFDVAGFPMVFEVTGGVGEHTKMPVAAYLFPDRLYSDFEQLNYYHNVPEYRTMNVMTFVEDLTNYDLRAARNLKWEVRADWSYRDNHLSVTYFREDMRNGFRYASDVHRYIYYKYDASEFDPFTAGHAPRIEDLPATETYYQAARSKVTNGSRSCKRGIEFSLQSRRIEALKTRLTVTGAWFVTTNCNSDPLWYKPGVIVAGKELPYIGLYDDRDGSRYESFNTNFLFDTSIPKLNLNFSLGIQNMWFTSRRTLYKDGMPTHYVDLNGDIHPYNAESAADPYLSQLIRRYSASAFDKVSVPLATTFNLKATKTFWRNRVGVALYVNRIFAIMPDYERYGVTMRRYTSPYFGMEINFKI